MARELVTHIWCDMCLSPGEGKEPTYTKGEELPAVTIAPMKPRLLALCEPHRKEWYDPFKDLVARLGQVVPDGGYRAAVAPSAAPRALYPCPVPDCPKHAKPFKHDTSLSKHAREVHGMTTAELQAEYGAPEPVAQPDLFEVAPGAEPPPKVQREECTVDVDGKPCGKVFQWPTNKRPTQALGVHKARVHGIASDKAKAKASRARRGAAAR